MNKGFFFSADAGMFVALTLLATILVTHSVGYALDRISGTARAESIRIIAESAVDTLLLSGDRHCTIYGEPVPGCITQPFSKDELGLPNCSVDCPAVEGCGGSPPDDADLYVLEFNVCMGDSVDNCTMHSCRMVVWR